MFCVEKNFLIVVLLLGVVLLFFSIKREKFNYNEYKKNIETKPLDAKVIEPEVYNYNPVNLQCPEDSKEIVSWDANTTVCKKGTNYINKECPKEMIREGDYCYMPCEEKYERKNGICWLK
jgi:hypothetical protein